MSNELQTLTPAVINNYTPEQIDLITKTVAKNATKDELALFLYRCNMMGLNPLKPGQIHFVKYGSGTGTIIVGIEGFRSIAARTGKLSGIARGATRNDKGELISAWAEVSRSDWQKPAREEVPLAEYNKTSNPIWKSMPETMLKKVAECAALRMAFPDDLGGVFESAEMDQAKPINVHAAGYEQPTEEDGGGKTDGVWRFSFGSFQKKSLDEVYRDKKVGPDKMIAYIETLDNHIANGKYMDKHDLFKDAQTMILNFLIDCDDSEISNRARTLKMIRLEMESEK